MADNTLEKVINEIVQRSISSCSICDCPPNWALVEFSPIDDDPYLVPFWSASDQEDFESMSHRNIDFDERQVEPVRVSGVYHTRKRMEEDKKRAKEEGWRYRERLMGNITLGPKFIEMTEKERCEAVFYELGRLAANWSEHRVKQFLPDEGNKNYKNLEDTIGSYWKGDYVSSFPQIWMEYFTNDQKLYGYSRELYFITEAIAQEICNSIKIDSHEAYARSELGFGFNHCEMTPGNVLYHTTSNLPSVEALGLKTRAELQGTSAAGLGGGPDDTISLTKSKMIADAIARALVEAIMFLNDEITVDQLLELSKSGYLAHRPYYEDLKRITETYLLATLEKGAVFEVAAWGDYATDDSRKYLGFKAEDIPKGCEPYESDLMPSFVDMEGNKRFGGFYRPLTEKETLNYKWKVFQRFLWSREHANGTYDPLFFGVDERKIKELDRNKVGQVKYTWNPDNPLDIETVEGMVYKRLAMAEVRVPSSKNIVPYEDWKAQEIIKRTEE